MTACVDLGTVVAVLAAVSSGVVLGGFSGQAIKRWHDDRRRRRDEHRRPGYIDRR